jgi:hypothetical protein
MVPKVLQAASLIPLKSWSPRGCFFLPILGAGKLKTVSLRRQAFSAADSDHLCQRRVLERDELFRTPFEQHHFGCFEDDCGIECQ